MTEHQTGSQYNPWQFAGSYFDSSTLYYKYGTRYYDRFGRWTKQDPQPSPNPYLYANDDPVNLVDPSGNDPITTQGIIKSCILGFIGGVLGAYLPAIAAIVTASAPVSIPGIATVLVLAILGCIVGETLYDLGQ